jgi:hypothetical protein
MFLTIDMLDTCTERLYKCTDPQREEIHRAIIKEFEAVSKKTQEQKIKLCNGLFQQSLADKYIYKFDTPRDPERKIEPDKPYVFTVDGRSINGSIFSIHNKYVEVELWENLGRQIPIIEIIMDLKILLDLVDRRIADIDRNPDKYQIATSNFLFAPMSDESVSKLKLHLNHNARLDDIGLTSEQMEALSSTLRKKLTVIWGPPGTGKTKTLQGVLAELLANDRKVLFASNTNTAIDGLLKDLIPTEKTPYEIFTKLKEEGKILRIGSQTDDRIKQVFSPFAVAKKKEEEISSDIEKLKQSVANYHSSLDVIKEEIEKYEKAKSLKAQISQIKSNIDQIPSDDVLSKKSANMTAQRDDLIEFLQSTMSATKIAFSNLDDLSKTLSSEKDKARGFDVLLDKSAREINENQVHLEKLKKQLTDISRNVIKKVFSRKKANKLTIETNNLSSKINAQRMKYREFKLQRNECMSNTAILTGKFSRVLEDLLNVEYITRMDVTHLKHCIAELQINCPLETNPLWIEQAMVLNLISPLQHKKIIVLNGSKDIFEKYVNDIYERQHEVLDKVKRINSDKKRKLSSQLKTTEHEYSSISSLLEKQDEYWQLQKEAVQKLSNGIRDYMSQITALQDKIKLLEKQIITDASLICCTMVKASYDDMLLVCNFDVLVVDELSMVSLPQLYCVASIIKERIVLCGDHLQLQPIAVSQSDLAKKWLSNSYIAFIEKDEPCFKENKKLHKLEPLVAKLCTQHRMPPKVSNLIKDWYARAGVFLIDEYRHERIEFAHGQHFLSNDTENIYFIDTTAIKSYHSRTSDRSPYNFVNAAIVAEIIRELVEDESVDLKKICCISPYRAQYLLTRTLLHRFLTQCENKDIDRACLNVHKFQGREAQIIFYDLTDGRQRGFTAFIKTEDFYIHNVAISRCKDKLVFIGDISKLKQLQEKYPNASLKDVLSKVIGDDHVSETRMISAAPYKDRIFRKYTHRELLDDSAFEMNTADRNKLIILNSALYYKCLKADIRKAAKSILIISPFVTKNRWYKFKNEMLFFKNKNPENTVEIITRPPNRMFVGQKYLNMAAVEILNEFLSLGFKVKVSHKVHSKLVVIDRGTNRAIAYWGSLNPLSFNNTDEINTRFQDRHVAESLINMSVVRRIQTYLPKQIDQSLIHSHTLDIAKRQLTDLRWTLAGFYGRPVGAICSNATLDKILELLPANEEEYKQIPQFNRKNFVLWNHVDEVEDIISSLRLVNNAL